MPKSADCILQVFQERFDALDTKMPEKARDPLRAPAHLLGHLAWSRGLDYWGDFSLSTKRQLANLAPANLRIRGTRAAIDNAVAAFATELEIEEWWETDPEGIPGTATATIAEGSYLETDPATQSIIVRLLARESRKSIHWLVITLISGLDALASEARSRVGTLYQFSGVQAGA